MKVEISKEAVEFLKGFCHELKTQDNRGTASPYFYVVECVKDEVRPLGHGGHEVYHDPEICETFSPKEYEKYCEENGLDFDEEKRRCYHADIEDGYVHKNVFFTKKGYEEHIKLNGHNYRHYNKFYSYIQYAGRNPEIEGLLKTIKEIGERIEKQEKEEKL